MRVATCRTVLQQLVFCRSVLYWVLRVRAQAKLRPVVPTTLVPTNFACERVEGHAKPTIPDDENGPKKKPRPVPFATERPAAAPPASTATYAPPHRRLRLARPMACTRLQRGGGSARYSGGCAGG